MKDDDYLPQIPTLAEAAAWLERRSGSTWTLARTLEQGLRASVWIDYSADPAQAVLFEGRTEGILAELVFQGDVTRLAAGAEDGLLTMTRRPSGDPVRLIPGFLFPLANLRFKRDELLRLAERNGWKAEKKRGGEVKKGALIAKYKARWPTIETDIKRGSENGLSAAAKSTRSGWWHDEAAADWAQVNGHIEEGAITAQPWVVRHKVR